MTVALIRPHEPRAIAGMRVGAISTAAMLAAGLMHPALVLAQTEVGREISEEEQPPTLVGLWISLGLLILIATVIIGRQRRAERRADLARWVQVAPEPLLPAARGDRQRALREAQGLVRDLDEAWADADGVGLGSILAPPLDATWTAIRHQAADPGRIDEYRMIRVDHVGQLPALEGEDERVMVRLEASARPLHAEATPSTGAVPDARAPGTRWYRWRKAVLAASGLAATLVSLAVVLGRTVDFSGPAVAVEEIVVREGRVISGPPVMRFRLGDRLKFDVDADVRDTVRLTGYEFYDATAVVGPGQAARIDTFAGVEGRFEVRLDDGGLVLARVIVSE